MGPITSYTAAQTSTSQLARQPQDQARSDVGLTNRDTSGERTGRGQQGNTRVASANTESQNTSLQSSTSSQLQQAGQGQNVAKNLVQNQSQTENLAGAPRGSLLDLTV